MSWLQDQTFERECPSFDHAIGGASIHGVMMVVNRLGLRDPEEANECPIFVTLSDLPFSLSPVDRGFSNATRVEALGHWPSARQRVLRSSLPNRLSSGEYTSDVTQTRAWELSELASYRVIAESMPQSGVVSAQSESLGIKTDGNRTVSVDCRCAFRDSTM
jgi:hypothetical protein